jgi:hypothetical protein
MWFDEDITLAIQTDPFINVSGTTSFSQISNVTVDLTEQPIIINLSENYAPVQSVNGKIGFVTITKEDLGITGSIVTSGDLSNYATITNLRLTGSALNSQIDFLTGNVVFLTGSQIISGVKNFIFRPTVNGTGILLSGETPVLPSNIVFTDLNQFISGQKTFLIQPNKSFWVDSESLDGAHGYLYIDQDYSSFGYNNNQIRVNDSNIEINGPVSFNDYLFLNNDLYSNSDLYARDLFINRILDQEDSSSILEMHSGSIVLKPNAAGGIGYVSIEPPFPQYSSFVELRVHGNAYARNLVYTTGNQTVSGTKSFSGVVNINSGIFLTRPTVNGTGVLLSGEAASLPTTIVYTTGNQTVSGTKSFSGVVNINSGTFLTRPTVNGTGVLLSGEAASLPTTIVYTTGNQTVSGTKSFSGVVNINSGTFLTRPTVNGTGVLLSGEAASLPTTIVYTTGNQAIGGNKDFYGDEIVFSGLNVIFADNTGISYGKWQFSNRPTVNGTGVLLNGEAYPSNNPSGFITGVNLSNYATTGQLNQASGTLQGQINILNVNSIAYAIALG